MSEFSITSSDFEEGGEIPKKFGYKHGNEQPNIEWHNIPVDALTHALIMDDPDAMGAVGKIWVHFLWYVTTKRLPDFEGEVEWENVEIYGKTDFGECHYDGPAPPDKRHTYVFKAYTLDTQLDLKEGYSKQELEDAMKGHIIAEAKLTGTFAP
jgi:Raf kinase inhibitor-like YbhB/YbcL family protein|tara:strand:+ start:47 stop:505 length:459 start_codon:yes stop_codon:yes gene_type:complete